MLEGCLLSISLLIYMEIGLLWLKRVRLELALVPRFWTTHIGSQTQRCLKLQVQIKASSTFQIEQIPTSCL